MTISQSRFNLILDKLAHARNTKKAKKISHRFRGYILQGDTVIDIGLGNGLNALQVRNDYGADLVGIDIIDYNRSPIPLVLFDGKTIPFADNEFDIALVIGVFHHCDHPIRIFEEAVRVARRVMILEDVYTSKNHLWIIKRYDYLLNFRHGVNVPFHFKKHGDWLNLFREHGLKIIAADRYRSKPFYSPMRTMFYVVDK